LEIDMTDPDGAASANAGDMQAHVGRWCVFQGRNAKLDVVWTIRFLVKTSVINGHRCYVVRDRSTATPDSHAEVFVEGVDAFFGSSHDSLDDAIPECCARNDAPFVPEEWDMGPGSTASGAGSAS
jgi:hypothetical protein